MEDLFHRCLGNLDLVERVLRAFESHFESDLEELEAALRANCFERVAQISHRMKGACSNVAATPMARTLASLEQWARDENRAEAAACMDRLREDWQQFVAAEKDFTGLMAATC